MQDFEAGAYAHIVCSRIENGSFKAATDDYEYSCTKDTQVFQIVRVGALLRGADAHVPILFLDVAYLRFLGLGPKRVYYDTSGIRTTDDLKKASRSKAWAEFEEYQKNLPMYRSWAVERLEKLSTIAFVITYKTEKNGELASYYLAWAIENGEMLNETWNEPKEKPSGTIADAIQHSKLTANAYRGLSNLYLSGNGVRQDAQMAAYLRIVAEVLDEYNGLSTDDQWARLRQDKSLPTSKEVYDELAELRKRFDK